MRFPPRNDAKYPVVRAATRISDCQYICNKHPREISVQLNQMQDALAGAVAFETQQRSSGGEQRSAPGSSDFLPYYCHTQKGPSERVFLGVFSQLSG
jgi:hypothetical protein